MPRETTIHWPEVDLGCPLRSRYLSTRGLKFQRIEVMDGPARFRLITDDSPFRIRCAFAWNPLQFYLFEQFYRDTLEGGSLWFFMRHMTGQGMQDMVVHIMNDIGYTNSNAKGMFELTLDLEAFTTAYSAPPPVTFDGPVDAKTASSPSVNIYDAGLITSTLPTDVINALVPGAIPNA